MLVYIGGEDQVTKLIAERLVNYCCKELSIEFEDITPRDYGAKALKKIDNAVQLGKSFPTICVFDSDGECVLTILNSHTSNGWKSEKCAINIAIDEAESWLLSDREGFADYFEIDIIDLPDLYPGNREISESYTYKTSLYILNELIPLSRSRVVKEELRLVGSKKPSSYNSIFGPFITSNWNIDNAMNNSVSLQRTIQRISNIF